MRVKASVKFITEHDPTMQTNPVTNKTLLDQLNWRYATKQFDPQHKISPENWATIEESLVLTPSSFGLQPWKFVIVGDPAAREKLVAASWGQRQVADASHLVVFAIKRNLGEKHIDAYLDRIAEVRGVSRDSLAGFREMLNGHVIKGMDGNARKAWATRQAYIALGNFLNSAAMMGIDACPLEGIEPLNYDEILKLSDRGLETVVAAAAGYRAVSDKYAAQKKVRFRHNEVLLHI
jgi:nitroreductase